MSAEMVKISQNLLYLKIQALHLMEPRLSDLERQGRIKASLEVLDENLTLLNTLIEKEGTSGNTGAAKTNE